MNITKGNKNMAPRMTGLVVLLVFVWLCPLGPLSVDASAMDYAVQVAALRSQESALDLAKGLRTQGINAYWVGKNMPQAGMFYRVRIGRFSSIESAYLYAEELMDSGLFTTYAIAAYEAPPPTAMAALSKNDAKSGADKVQAFFATGDGSGTTASTPSAPILAPREPSPRFSSSTIDLIASIGTRGWLLLSSQEILSTPRNNQTALGKELARLAASVGSRGWSLNNNIARLFAKPAPAPVEIARNTSTNNSSAISAPIAMPSPAEVIPAPAPATRASAAAISAPDINRRPLGPTAPGGIYPGARPVNYLSPPKLQGSIEMRDGRMVMTLRNLDPERNFAGSARITLTSDKASQDIAPMQLSIAPDREETFPINEARVVDGDWMMMVYDQNGTARLVRGASLAPKPAAAATPGQPDPNAASQGPPSYVTGMYDATNPSGGWKLSESVIPQNLEGGGPQPSNPVPNQTQASSSGASASGSAGNTGPPAPQPEVGPAQVTVTPRQIAVTTENVTMEFDIAASRPLNYIVITMRAGDFQDTRQALMSTPQGRVPFLIPVIHTSGPFTFEVKDESGAVLASGVGDFRRLSR